MACADRTSAQRRRQPETAGGGDGARSTRPWNRPWIGGREPRRVAGRGVRRGAAGLNTASAPMSPWPTRGWVQIERQGLTRPKRRDRAAKRGDHRPVRRRQTLWRRSRAAHLLAGRPVTPEHAGQQPPGVEGVATRTPQERRDVVTHLYLGGPAWPVRRVDSPQPGPTAQRPWGLPTMADRAQHAWVHHGLEPGGQAAVDPTSDGVRPGRSPGGARGAIDVQMHQPPTGGLDADLAQGVECLNHAAGVRTRAGPPTLRRQSTA